MSALDDPQWLAHRYDPDTDTIHLVNVPRALRRAKPFLTDEYLGPSQPIFAERGAVEAARGASRANFIFHSAYCCSTLLANALDISGAATVFKEPVLLNDIVGWLHRGGEPASISRVLNGAIPLLTPFGNGEIAVIKPSNVVNGLAAPMMAQQTDARAVLMFAPLGQFLASVARKGMWARLWVRELLAKQLTEGFIDLGFEARDYLLHTDLQVAAVGWLAQQKLFAGMVGRWPERVRTLNSEDLVAEPRVMVAAAAGFFDISLGTGSIDDIVEGVFARDTKSGAAFPPGERAKAAQASYDLHRDEIDKVVAWAEAVARSAGVSLDLTAASL